MLKGVSAAIKRAAPGVKVVAAGLPWPVNGTAADVYLGSMLRSRASRGGSDMFAVHPYGKLPVHVMNRVRYARTGCATRAERSTPVAREPSPAGSQRPAGRRARRSTSAASPCPRPPRPRYLSDLYRQALAARGTLKLAGLIWFSYRDTSPAPGGSFYWGFRTGLHRESGMPKPAWTAFSRFARSAR
jgi:hypothetical protein